MKYSDWGKLSFSALQQLAQEASLIQQVWVDLTPAVLRPAAKNSQAVDPHQLLSHFNLGGGRWVGKCAQRFPTSGIIGQEGVSPAPDKPAHPPIQLTQLWKSPTKRFKERSKSPGFKNAKPIWEKR